jgi:predicted unusual protein kinase regulating ubiquinone biosynthesis (AarF/ABC1/UbiB family)
MTIRLAKERNYDLLLPTMEKVGFIQKGQQVSVRDIDEMLRQSVEPVEVEVFHYTRKWLQKATVRQIDRSVTQIKTARQMDLPPKLAIPLRVIASVAAILCHLDAHVPVKALSEELIPGFAEPDTAVV